MAMNSVVMSVEGGESKVWTGAKVGLASIEKTIN